MSHEDIRTIIAVLSGLGGAYLFITRPIQSEMKAMEERFDRKIAELELRIEKRLTEIEKHINERIDTWIVKAK